MNYIDSKYRFVFVLKLPLMIATTTKSTVSTTTMMPSKKNTNIKFLIEQQELMRSAAVESSAGVVGSSTAAVGSAAAAEGSAAAGTGEVLD